MHFSKDELKLLAAAAVLNGSSPGGIGELRLSGLFARPGQLKRARESLVRWGLLTWDPIAGTVRLRAQEALKALWLDDGSAGTPPLFVNERPLDAALAEESRLPEPGAGMDGGAVQFQHNVLKIKHDAGEELSGAVKIANLSGDLSGNSLRSLPMRTEDVCLKVLKERHKGIKPLMELVNLKEALAAVQDGQEEEAYGALCGLLGGVVMEGGDLDGRGVERLGDGGKWRNRWRTGRQKVHRVMASLVEEMAEGRVKNRGGRAEFLWRELCK
jgi:hypothetical protein